MQYPFIGIRVPAALLERLDRVAPTAARARSAFIKDAIERRLAEVERQYTRPADLDPDRG